MTPHEKLNEAKEALIISSRDFHAMVASKNWITKAEYAEKILFRHQLALQNFLLIFESAMRDDAEKGNS